MDQLWEERKADSGFRKKIGEGFQGGVVLWEGEGEASSERRGVPALQIALASSWLARGMGEISVIGRGVLS